MGEMGDNFDSEWASRSSSSQFFSCNSYNGSTSSYNPSHARTEWTGFDAVVLGGSGAKRGDTPNPFHACFLSFLLSLDRRIPKNDLQLGSDLRAYQLLWALLLAHPGVWSPTSSVAALVERVENNFQELCSHITATVKLRYEESTRNIEWDEPTACGARAVRICEIQEIVDVNNTLTVKELERQIEKAFDKSIDIVKSRASPRGVVTWYLDAPFAQSTDDSMEEVEFEGNPMSPAPNEDLMPGGRFRGVVKLELCFLHDQTKITGGGTGWLLDEKTIVTAGHCVHNRQGKHLVSVKATLGFPNNSPETRYGTHVAVQWCRFKQFDKQHDLAMIRVSEPFETGLAYTAYRVPTHKARTNIMVAGFPKIVDGRARGVLYYNPDPETLRFPDAVQNGVLRHHQSTRGGSSGAPILCPNPNGSLAVIGTHTGGAVGESNRAVIFSPTAEEPNSLLRMSTMLHIQPSQPGQADTLYRWTVDGRLLCCFDWSPCRLR